MQVTVEVHRNSSNTTSLTNDGVVRIRLNLPFLSITDNFPKDIRKYWYDGITISDLANEYNSLFSKYEVLLHDTADMGFQDEFNVINQELRSEGIRFEYLSRAAPFGIIAAADLTPEYVDQFGLLDVLDSGKEDLIEMAFNNMLHDIVDKAIVYT